MRLFLNKHNVWHVILPAVLLTALWAGVSGAAQNVAPEATILASGEYSDAYRAANTANGFIPAPGSRADANAAWCLPANEAAGATLTYSWSSPVTIAVVVYYGRTAWRWDENFLELEIYAGMSDVPIGISALRKGHGPQPISLETPFETDTLTLRFTRADMGPNPGASEIALYAASPEPEQLGAFRPAPGEPVMYEESPALAGRVWDRGFGFTDMLVIERHELNPSHVYTYHNEDFRPGGGLYRMHGTGELEQLLDAGEGQLLDVDLCYDGREILFSWRRDVSTPYQVFRMPLEGGMPVQLTQGAHYNFNPCWLPDGNIVFLSTRESAYAYCWDSPVGVLHRMNRDGGEVTRISANYLNDFTPMVLEDGRIIYSRWEYVDRPAIPIQSLWTIHPDGTNLQVFFGNRVLSPATFMEARSIPGTDKVLCLLTAHNGPCRGGVGIIDRRLGVNAQAAIRNITPEVDIGRVDEGDGNAVRGGYENPYPINDSHFLVSLLGDIVVRDYDGTEFATLLAARDNGLGFYNPRPIRPVTRPPALPSVTPVSHTLDDKPPVARIYLQDVYQGLAPHVARGEVAAIRVVEEVAKPIEISPALRAFGFQFPVVSAGATYAPKAVWGETPVQPDGSAAFEVPANTPLYFMALDKHGRALQRMRSFTHFVPGETQTCIGCHEDRNTAPTLRRPPTAFSELPRPLETPEWGRGGFSYRHVVQPVLDRHCVSCHNANTPQGGVDLSGDLTDFFNVSYETLVRMGTPAEDAMRGSAAQGDFRNPFTNWISTYNGSEANILEITPNYWGAPASPLADLILSGHPDAHGIPRIRLNDDERRRVFAWIDLNVPYYGTSDSNHRERIGCRQMWPEEFEPVFHEVTARRCISCHGADSDGAAAIPRKWYLRVSAPEKNNFLLAPLARAAGGTEACGEAIFATTDDPDYQAILHSFASIRELLAEIPRMDMIPPAEGSICCPVTASEDRSSAHIAAYSP